MKERAWLLYIYLQNGDLFTARWRPWCRRGADAWRRMRRREEPPMAQTQGTSAGRGETELEGGTGILVLPEGRRGAHVAGGTEPRIHAEPRGRKGDLGVESGTFLGWSQCPWGALEKGLCPSVPDAARSCRGEGSTGVTARWSGRQAPVCGTGR